MESFVTRSVLDPELIFSSPKESPLLLPANVGAALKTCSRLRDFGVFVIGSSLPIYFAFFELMRQIISVEPLVRKAFYVFLLKCAIFVACVSLPRTIFAKALCQRRIWSSWVILSCCCILTIVGVCYLMPGSMGQKIMHPIPRCFSCLATMSVFPPAILRAFSRNTSAMFIILFFSIIYTHVAQFPFLSLNLTYSQFVLTCMCRLGYFVLYREHIQPYRAESSVSILARDHRLPIDSDWILYAASNIVFESVLLCLSLLLDKKHHRVQTGRKFFVAESLAASTSKRQ